ncbi:MAG: hypothetical protein Kow0098_05780 [Ignavibacteriaceae bacterium]
MKRCLLLLTMIFQALAFAQLDELGNITPKDRENGFSIDLLNFAGDQPGKTRVDVFIKAPYDKFQFIKSGDGFAARYSVTISVYDKFKSKIITEKIWNEEIKTESFNQTISPDNFNLSFKSFYLLPGDYVFRASLEDKEANREFTSENIFKVRDLSSGIKISDLMLIANRTVVEGNNRIIPNVTRNVAALENGIPFFFELYADKQEDIILEYRITNSEKNIIYSTNEIKNLDSGNTRIFYTIKDVELGLGSYILSVIVRNLNSELITQTNKAFFSQWIGVPSSVRDLDLAIEQMVYIASEKELNYIEEAESNEERKKRFLDFWKSKDPNPNNPENEVFEEYFRRVEYANANFSHYDDGWRSDRGMVYILLGAPNNIDRHPFDYDSKPYEIWQYYDLNREFVFVDETGFGDYKLITPLYGNEYRYR